MERTRLRWFGVLGLSLTLALSQVLGCGESGDGGDANTAGSLLELGIDDGASEGATATAIVATDKETVLSLKTGAEVKIAAGSTSKELTVTITRPPDKEALEYVKNTDKSQKLGSAPYVITPHGQAFTKQVEVTLPVAPQVNTDKLQVVYLMDEKDKDWKVVGKPEVSAGKAKIKVNHFSVLMLVEMETSPVGMVGDGPIDIEPSDAPEGSWTRVLHDKLRECRLIARNGEFDLGTDVPAAGTDDACDLECFRTTTCSELEQFLCAGEETGALGACEDACRAQTFTCNDGETHDLYVKCDGYQDCSDASDEAGCPAGTGFICGDGTSTYADSECDGSQQCSDGSDEANCASKQFACADGSDTVPLDYVCDLFVDCADGSDEPARCLKLTCEIMLGEGGEDSVDVGGQSGLAPTIVSIARAAECTGTSSDTLVFTVTVDTEGTAGMPDDPSDPSDPGFLDGYLDDGYQGYLFAQFYSAVDGWRQSSIGYYWKGTTREGSLVHYTVETYDSDGSCGDDVPRFSARDLAGNVSAWVTSDP